MSARWGNNANGYVEFVCQPPWVNLSPYEPYFRSHLEEVCAPQGPSDQGRSRTQSIYVCLISSPDSLRQSQGPA